MVHKLPLFVPGNDKPYATFLNLDDWMDGFMDVYGKDFG